MIEQYSQQSDRDEKLIEASPSEYSVTDSDRIRPVQIGGVTGPDSVHLRPDRLFTIACCMYATVLETLDEYGRSNTSTESKSRAAGLYDCLSIDNTLLCLTLAVFVFEILENLCTALQGRRSTVSGMLQTVNQTTTRLD